MKMVDNRRMHDGPWLYYKLTNEPKDSGELKRWWWCFEFNVPLTTRSWRRDLGFESNPKEWRSGGLEKDRLVHNPRENISIDKKLFIIRLIIFEIYIV